MRKLEPSLSMQEVVRAEVRCVGSGEVYEGGSAGSHREKAPRCAVEPALLSRLLGNRIPLPFSCARPRARLGVHRELPGRDRGLRTSALCHN